MFSINARIFVVAVCDRAAVFFDSVWYAVMGIIFSVPPSIRAVIGSAESEKFAVLESDAFVYGVISIAPVIPSRAEFLLIVIIPSGQTPGVSVFAPVSIDNASDGGLPFLRVINGINSNAVIILYFVGELRHGVRVDAPAGISLFDGKLCENGIRVIVAHRVKMVLFTNSDSVDDFVVIFRKSNMSRKKPVSSNLFNLWITALPDTLAEFLDFRDSLTPLLRS